MLGDGGQRLFDLLVEHGIGEIDRGGFFQHELLQPIIGHDTDAVAGDRAFVAFEFGVFFVDADDAALHRSRGAHRDFSAFQRLDESGV